MTIFENENVKNPQNTDGETPFHLVCRHGHFNVVNMLMQSSIKLDIKVNVKNENGRTAFHLACYYGYSNVAEILMQKFDRLFTEKLRSIELQVPLNKRYVDDVNLLSETIKDKEMVIVKSADGGIPIINPPQGESNNEKTARFLKAIADSVMPKLILMEIDGPVSSLLEVIDFITRYIPYPSY